MKPTTRKLIKRFKTDKKKMYGGLRDISLNSVRAVTKKLIAKRRKERGK
jgi:hypothetical protein